MRTTSRGHPEAGASAHAVFLAACRQERARRLACSALAATGAALATYGAVRRLGKRRRVLGPAEVTALGRRAEQILAPACALIPVARRGRRANR